MVSYIRVECGVGPTLEMTQPMFRTCATQKSNISIAEVIFIQMPSAQRAVWGRIVSGHVATQARSPLR